VTNYPELADPAPPLRIAPASVTVLLLDDHAAMLESVRAAVETDDTLVVVGTASRVQDAVRLAKATQPQVAVVDVNMPDGGGWAAAKGLREVCPHIRLVAFSSFDNPLVTRTITAAGMSAYVTKGSPLEVLLAAIHGEDVMPSPPRLMPLMRRTTGLPTD
jgi:DNA-binding NarL/FixJ family response regulator